MIALIAIGLGGFGAAFVIAGTRALGRAKGRRRAALAGMMMLAGIAGLVAGVTLSSAAWLAAVCLAGFGLVRAAAAIGGAASGRVGDPLSHEETQAFLARADRDPAIMEMTRDRTPVVARPRPRRAQPALGERTPRAPLPPAPVDEDVPPSL